MAVINGSSGGETLNGTADPDTISGLGGDDFLRGLGGADTLDGGTGYDTVGYDNDAANGGGLGVTVNLLTGQATDGFNLIDTLISIEGVRGTLSIDNLSGSNRTDETEQFAGLQGNDVIDGRGGFDEARYDRDASFGGTAGVTVNLSTGTATDGFGNTDTLLNIEAARGTNAVDTFIGSAFNNDFRGLNGADTFDGGGGTDFLRYDSDAGNGGGAGITATFTGVGTGTVIDGFGSTDTFTNIEGIRGTALTDTMTGGDGSEQFRGLAGNDVMNGGNGFDIVSYESDIFYSGVIGGVTVNLSTNTATDSFGNTDTITNIEEVRGTNSNDSITGGNRSENLTGLGGNDTLIGGRGFDFFSPGNGTNTVNGALNGGTDQSYGDQDTVSYNGSLGYSHVVVDLNTGVATRHLTAGGTEIDTLIDVERVRGTVGNDTFTGSSTANFRQERFQGLGGADTINGSNGFDYAAYQSDAGNGGVAGINANLVAGTVIDGFGATDTISNIEGIIGTASADTFLGNTGNNIFSGRGGADNANGGDGFDQLSFYFTDQIGGTGATVYIGAGVATQVDGATINFSNFEDFIGSYGNDIIYGGVFADWIDGDLGNDTIAGGDGDDVINGGGGADNLTGGNGNDWLGFRYDTDYPIQSGFDAAQKAAFGWLGVNWNWGGVTISLANTSATAPDGSTITYSGFENLSGTYYADNLTGDGNANIFRGAAGNDVINGGGGSDTVTYAPAVSAFHGLYIPLHVGSAPNGVTVDLAANTANDGEGGTDTFTSIENVIGSLGVDTITGNADVNRLEGGDGDDFISGGNGGDTLIGGNGQDNLLGEAGDDIIQGGAGSDTITGGAGADNIDGGADNDGVSYAGSAQAVTVFLSIGLGAGSGGDAQGDLLTSIENASGSSFDDSFVGAGGVSNVMIGGDGNDTFVGEGLDLILGGNGNDVFFGGQGGALNIDLATSSIETVFGSVGSDIMNGSGSGSNLTIVAQGASADTMHGGSGNDNIYFRAGDTISGGAGVDWAWGANSTGAITLNVGTTGFENVWGSALGDTLDGSSATANLLLVGDAGNDALTGGSGADFLLGFGDADTIIGGLGNDSLVGGTGNDIFRYNAAAFGTDLVWDFTTGQDTINMAGTGVTAFAQLTLTIVGAHTVVTSAATGSSAIWVLNTNALVAGDFLFV